MQKRNNKKYIKSMQKQIIFLKKYIVFLENKNSDNENKIKELEEKNNFLRLYKKTLIAMLFQEVK